MNRPLGHTYVDIISGFRGVSVGHVEYLTGCNQTLLQPTSKDPAVRPGPEWFDDQRLQHVGVPVVVLDNGATPGCDKPAPKC